MGSSERASCNSSSHTDPALTFKTDDSFRQIVKQKDATTNRGRVFHCLFRRIAESKAGRKPADQQASSPANDELGNSMGVRKLEVS